MKSTRPILKPAPPNESLKETAEALIIAFVLVFAFRAFVLEPFVIPTGSMANTLLGSHHRVACEQCSYVFAVDVPDRLDAPEHAHRAEPLGQEYEARCPMCAYDTLLEAGSASSAGDRIFVQKHAYQFSDPQRWDVAVFKAPHEPDIHYIKRVVGLPGEALYLLDGNVYVQPAHELGSDPQQATDWRIVRKTDRPRVQRTVFEPIYHSQYLPLDRGDPEASDRRMHWQSPWTPEGTTASAWQIAHRRTYHYRQDEPGRITFDFDKAAASPATLSAYNQWKPELGPATTHPIEQIRLATRIEPDEHGLELRLSTTARLHDGRTLDDPQVGTERLEARIAADGTITLEAVDLEDPDQRRQLVGLRARHDPTHAGAASLLQPGRVTEVELWFVDQQASLWIDGKRVLSYDMEPSWQTLLEREPAPRRPEVAIELAGSPTTLHSVELDQDIYYGDSHAVDGRAARGGLQREIHNGQVRMSSPAIIADGHFFVMGDNPQFSEDSRFWTEMHRWVSEHASDRRHVGLVPRDLVMGQAFFVYYPGPLGRQPHSPRLIPNFGEMRFIR